MTVGRNELCPCGSGKKYKKCCGVITSIEALRAAREQRLRQQYASWMERLNRSISAYLDPGSVEQARRQFAEQTGLTAEDVSSPEWTPHLLNWLVFDVVHDGQTVLERFLGNEGRRMEREMQEGFRSLSLGLYEVVGRADDACLVRDLTRAEERQVVGISGVEPQPGQILVGRLLPLGQRDQLFSGSMILPPRTKGPLTQWMQQLEGAAGGSRAYLRERVTELYRMVVELTREQAGVQESAAQLVRREYAQAGRREQITAALQAHQSFELKKREPLQDIWVFSAQKEEALLPALNNCLLEVHEVIGEVIVQADKVTIEAFSYCVEEAAKLLELEGPFEETPIDELTSTGKMLTRGTMYITSQPVLPAKLLQWAVQTHFAERWLAAPNPALAGVPPLLAAASEGEEQKQALARAVDLLEREAAAGIGAGRFMRLDLIRPRLALPNETLHPANLLKRPLVEGMTDSAYTVSGERLAEMAQFVTEMTEGKSESTVKKYDEAMNLFRTFVRSAYGPSFAWESLRPEEVAYFLVIDVPKRVDGLTKTLANNLLSVLAAFFKWLDKRGKLSLASRMQPLFGELKEHLAEAYRLRSALAKEAARNLHDDAHKPDEAGEERFLLVAKHDGGWRVRRENGEEVLLSLDPEAAESLSAHWLLAGVAGRTAAGEWWRFYGTPDVCPPAVSQLLGADVGVPV